MAKALETIKIKSHLYSSLTLSLSLSLSLLLSHSLPLMVRQQRYRTRAATAGDRVARRRIVEVREYIQFSDFVSISNFEFSISYLDLMVVIL